MQYIGEIKLFANGFLHARILATKMVTLYRYASELLSKQVLTNRDASHESLSVSLPLVPLRLGLEKFQGRPVDDRLSEANNDEGIIRGARSPPCAT